MIPIKSADRTRKEMQDLEAMAAKLLETARKLPSEQDRHNALQEIERFRARITALQRLSGMAQSPQPYDLVTRPCTIHAGRFRWDIRENGRPVQSSMEAFATVCRVKYWPAETIERRASRAVRLACVWRRTEAAF
jgi:hypothetical protein